MDETDSAAVGVARMRVTVPMLMTVSGLLTACSTTEAAGPAPQGDQVARVCRPDAAADLVGHAAPDDTLIQQRTSAVLIRRIAPGEPVTHNFRDNSITVAIDPVGKVVQANCG